MKIQATDHRRRAGIGKALNGDWTGRYSYRVGPYRIIYEPHRRELLVLVIRIGQRQSVY